MEQKNITPIQAFEIIFQMTGQLQLNRADASVLDSALRTLAPLVQEKNEGEINNEN